MTIELRTGIDTPLGDDTAHTTLHRTQSLPTPPHDDDADGSGTDDAPASRVYDTDDADARAATEAPRHSNRIPVEHAERNAAYVAGRMAVAAVRDATSTWGPDLARSVQRSASDGLAAIIEALAHDPTSPERRRELRRATISALELVIAFDIALSHGFSSREVHAALRASTRMLSMIGLAFHATVACGD